MKRLTPHSTWWQRMPHREKTRSRAHGRGPAMDHVGIDVHKGASQICMITEEGERIERRVRTDASRLAEALEDRVRARILIEASTEREWVARCLERLGHDVIVADPNFAPMYATRQRTVKTDRRAARALAEACVVGAYRPAHRLSDAQRHVRGRLAVRDALVRTRTRYITLIRSRRRQAGGRVPPGTAEGFSRRVLALPLPGRLRSEVAPLLAVMRQVTRQVAYSDERIAVSKVTQISPPGVIENFPPPGSVRGLGGADKAGLELVLE